MNRQDSNLQTTYRENHWRIILNSEPKFIGALKPCETHAVSDRWMQHQIGRDPWIKAGS